MLSTSVNAIENKDLVWRVILLEEDISMEIVVICFTNLRVCISFEIK